MMFLAGASQAEQAMGAAISLPGRGHVTGASHHMNLETTRKFRTLGAVALLWCIFVSTNSAHASAWARTYVGTAGGNAKSVIQSSDGGFVVVGSVRAIGQDNADAWALKVDANGDLMWSKSFGGAGSDEATAVTPTSDGGYIVVGTVGSLAAGRVDTDAWVLKLTSNGQIEWQRSYGGPSPDRAAAVQPTGDGGYIVAGVTSSFRATNTDAWVLKLDGVGNLTWQKTFGRGGYDGARSVQPTADGGYVVAGVLDDWRPYAWVVRLDADGGVVWQRILRGPGSTDATSIRVTADGGYVVAGEILGDAWVIKLDAGGSILWQKTYGGTRADRAPSIEPVSGGGYVLAGSTYSFGAGGTDVWVTKLDDSGEIVWQQTYGGAGGDEAGVVRPTSDGGFIVVGQTDSFGAGNVQAFVLKLDSLGLISGCAYGAPANATAAASNGSAWIGSAIIGDSNATPIVTAAVAMDASVIGSRQCYYAEASAASDVPALPPMGVVWLSCLVGLLGGAVTWRMHRVGQRNARVHGL